MDRGQEQIDGPTGMNQTDSQIRNEDAEVTSDILTFTVGGTGRVCSSDVGRVD